MRQAISAIVILFLLCSCSENRDEENSTDTAEQSQTQTAPSAPESCISCHEMTLDKNHDFGCSGCHGGDEKTGDRERAHAGLIRQPAHPDNMALSCGRCHRSLVDSNARSSHFTLRNAVNIVRRAFGATQDISSLVDIPVTEIPETPLQLADDLLRRRCLRCHPYSSGDRYPAVARGTGCASCHLEFSKGKLVSHSFLKKPTDRQCLQCHYGNRVGADYYGRYDHDMNDEYRTPYTTRQEYFRPYGIEYHQLSTDIHQQRGMVCIDCHFGTSLMGVTDSAVSCQDCHSAELPATEKAANISRDPSGTKYVLQSANGRLHDIPVMKHPAHKKYNSTVNCQVCHAQWAFTDRGTHLLRNDLDEYDDFARLSVQGSFEVEKVVINNLDFSRDEIPHTMSDKITGQEKTGLWYLGYETRRWEDIIIGRDSDGKLQVMRPLLDMSLSWVDEDEELRFDNLRPGSTTHGLSPYIPHTTGKAGLFYRERLRHYLRTGHDTKR